jgi:predicted Fe-S protein YdhL (DUF1289 family)
MVPRDFGPRRLMSTIETTIESPCNRVCVVHPGSRQCIGCGRTLDEIAQWAGLTGAERRRIMAQLPARLAAVNAANATPATA